MVRTLPYGSHPRLDFGRILAYAAVVAVHAFALLLLLIPMAAPKQETVLPDPLPVINLFEPIITKTPPKPPEIVKPAEPKPAQAERKIIPKAPAPATDPVIVDNGTIAADPVVQGDPVADIAPPSGPVSVNHLAYLKATPPPYPRAEQAAGIEGTVLLRILVDTDGTPLEVTVERSSGSHNLDRAAQRHVLKAWRFQPAMQDGRAVQAYGLVPIVFSIQ
ncbi:energy transducer TonB [Pseudoxanthomonas sangjuensis]|uniref:energy transducer TonB n=1 Tax=Pseudoxanthomonas sangjuensis TaxID=1503750 RepID=UPI0013918BF1|nr:energy transducer TonB [Pseudoxanthomonas sangjuensis]KAF1715305.1 energy transducer TonB [Pseudoxanthomonas sangjuensis]